MFLYKTGCALDQQGACTKFKENLLKRSFMTYGEV